VIPAERVNKLFRSPDELVRCPNCLRILYLDNEMKAAVKK
jgi:predicted  nucleic acid-binding Zn-ribbon protein